MSIALVQTLSTTLSDSELSDAINILVKARKDRQADQLLEMKSSLLKGDTVEFYHSERGHFIQGVVTKAKTKKALVKEAGSSMIWDVPMGMLKKVS
tara:strand:- start:287 stop:574 length:288 start_codon:yes stop_codon:yes gene_type:complete